MLRAFDCGCTNEDNTYRCQYEIKHIWAFYPYNIEFLNDLFLLNLIINFPGGYYMYIETSAPRHNGDKAQLISPRQQPQARAGPRCLRFWYHMYGAHINALNVYVMTGARLGTAVWTRKGTQGNRWIQASLVLNSTSAFNVSERLYKLEICFHSSTYSWRAIVKCEKIDVSF